MSVRGKRKQEADCEVSSVENKSKYFGNVKDASTSEPKSNDVNAADSKISDANVGKEADDNSDGNSVRLVGEFYNKPCTDLAQALLGKRVVRLVNGERLSGRIVETEAYLGLEDKAAHSYKGKKTDKNTAMFMTPGTSYVYNIYGVYCCFNISSQGEGAAVLIRALEVIEGAEVMRKSRMAKTSKAMKDKDLTNGPSKLCQALQINKGLFNKVDLATSQELWLEQDTGVEASKVVRSPRINIGYAEEWVDKHLRFYVLGSSFVSVRNKECEAKCPG
ncbi:probable DNA-3-methyladenine glycosylase [Aplysia californica]|uniref:DNA-3-methyladenine glycosylase II n=1 Tax=Aplysia californica TaxID=6500 RepID=A0ABM0JPY2_APLCA|nr:probable DNA-3-methyladenine glycosylase [Aplysia californica]